MIIRYLTFVITFIITSHASSEIKENIYGFPPSQTTLKELNFKGNIESFTKNGYSITTRYGRRFHKIVPKEVYKFNESGQLLSYDYHSEWTTSEKYHYKNGNLDKTIISRSIKGFSNTTNEESTTRFYYKNLKLYGVITKTATTKGCHKFIYEDTKIIKNSCHTNNQSVYEINKDGKIKTITTIPEKFSSFKDSYIYQSNLIKIKNTSDGRINRETTIELDKFGNYINKTTINLSDDESTFGKKLVKSRSQYEILKFDQYGNPESAILTHFETLKGSKEKTIKTIHEKYEYSYFN